jgi:hypothetical protein
MADNVLEILVKATDLASGTLKKVDAEVEKLGKTAPATGSKWSQAMAGMKSAASSSMGQMLTLAGGVTAVGGAVVATAKFVQGAVNDWTAYNEEVRKLGIATGASVEDLSRMMQAADDVGVSMDAMSTAMKLAAKNGVKPTVDNIAALSDRLRAMSSDTERSQEMAKIFGRGWAEIAPFILQGGDAIREASAAIADNLVVTDQSVQASRDYMVAMDSLNDSFTGVKNTVAQGVVPAMAAFLGQITETGVLDDYITKMTAIVKILLLTNPAFRDSAIAIGSTADEMLGLTPTLDEASNKFDAMAEDIRETTAAEQELSAATQASTDANIVAYKALQEYNAVMMSTRDKAAGTQTTLRRLEQSFLNAGYSAEEAAAMVGALRNQINGLHNKEVLINVRINMPQGGVVVRGGQLDYQNLSPAEEIIYQNQYEDWLQENALSPTPTGSMTQGNTAQKPLSDAEKTKRAKANRAKWAERKKGAGGATGLDMIVPSGYPNDSYPVWATSGERVLVETKEQQKQGGGDTYIMHVHTNAPVSTVINDFNLMRALGG